VPGDTWWDICQRFYKDGTYYHKLIDYNKMKKEDLIRGLVIQIPPKEELDGI
jgi:nucleoid-associated protein YgaU